MSLLERLDSPILLKGDGETAFRDPAVIYRDGCFRLFYTWTKTERNGEIFMYTAMSRSTDLRNWSAPQPLTPRDRRLNFSSPGNIVRYRDRWLLCLQTYPRPNGEQYGNADSRIWTMESDDLEHWETPRLLKVKGNEVPVEHMGRMIDPYLIEDNDVPGKWWCFYKQNGVSMSYSHDLEDWTFAGHEETGENVCIVRMDDKYVLFHSPRNGIGVMRSEDLRCWQRDEGLITLGQADWEWARGRLTAGFVLDATCIPGVGKYLLFFHGSGPGDERVHFDTHASIGLAWSDNLENWNWPGNGTGGGGETANEAAKA